MASGVSEEFEAGVLFAMEILKKQIMVREDKISAALPTLSREEGGVLHSTGNVLRSVMINFENEMLKGLNAKRVALKEKKP